MKLKYSNQRKNPKYVMTFEKIIQKRLLKIYGPRNQSSLKYQYMGLIMNNLIFNKNTHEVTVFKDFMIWDYCEEFLKRFYLKKESSQRVPKFSIFYKNYLKFFCIPTLKDTFPNEVVHTCSEKKAELFYNENYKRKKKDNSELKDCGIYQDTESDVSESKNENQNLSKKLFFNETARKKIERNSPINTSMVLNESETKIKEDESGLLITASEIDSYNENSLRDIITGMKKKNKINIDKQKLTLYANDYISSKMINKNSNKNQNKNGRNKSLDILSNNNNNINKNESKQLTTYNITKDKKIEKIIINNYLNNINDSNQINKRNNNSKVLTSLNNNITRNRTQNQQIISTINDKTHSKNNNLDKISNIKKTINLNLIKSKNIQTIFGKYNPSIYINSKNEKKLKNFNKTINHKENITNSAKNIFIKNNDNNLKMSSNKYFIKNSSYSQVKLPKANSIKASKNTERILSYKNYQKSESQRIKKNRNKNVINAKLSFDTILHNNNNSNYKRYNIINNNNNSNNKGYNIINYNGDKHVHNINININNNINIGSKQFQEIFTFSDLLKKQNKKMSKIINKNNNNIHNFLKSNNNKNMNYISRNKNQNVDLHLMVNNTNNNKINSATDIHNSLSKNSIYKTQYVINKGKADSIYNFKHKKINRIQLNNENILSSLKAKI